MEVTRRKQTTEIRYANGDVLYILNSQAYIMNANEENTDVIVLNCTTIIREYKAKCGRWVGAISLIKKPMTESEIHAFVARCCGAHNCIYSATIYTNGNRTDLSGNCIKGKCTTLSGNNNGRN